MTVKVNGDFHQFEFEGMAQDLIDNSSFAPGMGQANELSRRTSDWGVRLLDRAG